MMNSIFNPTLYRYISLYLYKLQQTEIYQKFTSKATTEDNIWGFALFLFIISFFCFDFINFKIYQLNKP